MASRGVVHLEHRGRGIGSSLLSRIEERASHMLAGLPSAGSATLSTRRLVECAFIAIGIISLLAFLLMRQEATAGTDAALGQAFIAIYDRAFLIGPGFFAGVAPGTSPRFASLPRPAGTPCPPWRSRNTPASVLEPQVLD